MGNSDDNNVYIKRGRKYVPFGMKCGEDYLPDGIWYVRHGEHSYGYTNADHYIAGLYRVGDSPQYIDIPKLCSMHSYTEYVLNSPEFKELMDRRFSYMELVAKVVALVVKLNQTLKNKEEDGTR